MSDKRIDRLERVVGTLAAWFSLLVITPICIALSLLIAWPFHAYVERPFMSARQKRNEVAPAIVPA